MSAAKTATSLYANATCTPIWARRRAFVNGWGLGFPRVLGSVGVLEYPRDRWGHPAALGIFESRVKDVVVS
jgi:hypothetical protein